MNNVLIVNHSQEKCGVYQYGKNTAHLLSKSIKYNFVYAECDNKSDLALYIKKYVPIAIVYNYHVSTLGWVTSDVIKSFGLIPQLTIQHEPHQPQPSGINIIISQDPSQMEWGNHYSVPRILHEFKGIIEDPSELTFGTFGFGMAGKGFDRVVERVCQEFDEATIRMHIPYAHFGDQSGVQARNWASLAQSKISKPGVKLIIDHDWFTKDQLLQFLANNHMNIFMYESFTTDRGVTAVLDFSLSVPRPIAITKSFMFQHVWKVVPEVLIENSSLVEILNRGTVPLQPLYDAWSPEKFVASYERIIGTVCPQ